MPTEAGLLRLTWHGYASGASGFSLMISMGWAKKAIDMHCVAFLSMLVVVTSYNNKLL